MPFNTNTNGFSSAIWHLHGSVICCQALVNKAH